MRIRRKKIRLDRGETRVGNFVLAVTGDRVEVRDIGGGVSFSVSRAFPKGALLESMAKDGSDGLRGLLAVTWNFLSVVPDMELLRGVNRLCVECAGRHPELYGSRPGATDEEHAVALDGVRMDAEAAEALAKGPEGGEGER